MDGEGSPSVLPILFKLWCRRMFVQQVGMESGIDIKFPSFALAVAKLRMGRGDHHREDSDDVHAAGRECHLNSAGEKYSVLGSNICTGTLAVADHNQKLLCRP